MARKDWKIVGITAALTALVVLPSLWPSNVAATRNRPGAKLLKQYPKLVASGCEVSARPEHEQYKPGDKPILLVSLENKTDGSIRLEGELTMSRVRFASPMARMGPLPVQVFRHELVVQLAPNQKTTVRVPTNVPLQGASDHRIIVRIGGKTRLLASFGTPLNLSASQVLSAR